jgi:hypothetical protein
MDLCMYNVYVCMYVCTYGLKVLIFSDPKGRMEVFPPISTYTESYISEIASYAGCADSEGRYDSKMRWTDGTDSGDGGDGKILALDLMFES